MVELIRREVKRARFSVPSQPVYDEEAIARWLRQAPGIDWLATTPQEIAAALAAALRGGELTREETNRG